MQLKKQSKVVMLISIIAIVAIVLSSTGPMFLTPQDYGTGMDADTTSVFQELTKKHSPRTGKTFLKGHNAGSSGYEIFPQEKYILSWQGEKELSEQITAKANFMYHAQSCCEGWWCACGYLPGVGLGRYWVTIDYIDTEGTEVNIINTKRNYINGEYATITRPPTASLGFTADFEMDKGHHLPNANYQKLTMLGTPPEGEDKYSCWHTPWTETDGNAKWYPKSTETLEFKMKGAKVGKLVYKAYIDTFHRNNIHTLCGWNLERCNYLFAQDECYLASGDGEIRIEAINSDSILGQEQVIHSDETTYETYAKYLFEEEETIHISVDTHFSGKSLDPEDPGYGQGWWVKIYGADGHLKSHQPVPDDVRNYKITYTIPAASFVEGGDNEWRVELWNTLYKQKEIRFFGVKDKESTPGWESGTTVETFDAGNNPKTKFRQGDYVYMKCYANATPQTPDTPYGTGEISRWYVIAKYGGADSVKMVEGFPQYIPATKVGGLRYKGSTSFQLSSSDFEYGNVYLRVHPVDETGQKGRGGEATVFSEQLQGNYQVTVIVTSSGVPIAGAKVLFGTMSHVSDVNGRAVFGLNYGQYDLKVTKSGYVEHSRPGIYVQGDDTIPVEITQVWSLGNYWLILGIVAIIVGGIGFYIYQKKGGKIDFKSMFRRKKK